MARRILPRKKDCKWRDSYPRPDGLNMLQVRALVAEDLKCGMSAPEIIEKEEIIPVELEAHLKAIARSKHLPLRLLEMVDGLKRDGGPAHQAEIERDAWRGMHSAILDGRYYNEGKSAGTHLKGIGRYRSEAVPQAVPAGISHATFNVIQIFLGMTPVQQEELLEKSRSLALPGGTSPDRVIRSLGEGVEENSDGPALVGQELHKD